MDTICMLNYNRSLYHRRRRRAAANQFRDAETLIYYIYPMYMILYRYIVHSVIWVRRVLYIYTSDIIITIAHIPVRSEKKT